MTSYYNYLCFSASGQRRSAPETQSFSKCRDATCCCCNVCVFVWALERITLINKPKLRISNFKRSKLKSFSATKSLLRSHQWFTNIDRIIELGWTWFFSSNRRITVWINSPCWPSIWPFYPSPVQDGVWVFWQPFRLIDEPAAPAKLFSPGPISPPR